MRAFSFAGISGWAATILIGVVALLPYLLRRSSLSVRLGFAPSSQTALFAAHVAALLAGVRAAALSFVHAWMLMSGRVMARTNSLGLYLATLALMLLFLQIAMGLALQQRSLPERRSVRSWHFWTMAGVVVLVGGHIWMNG